MFSTNRDLLVLEPRLFHDVGWSAQTLLSSTSAASINAGGTTLTVTGADFASLAIDTGDVVLVAGTPLEVLSLQSATQLLVSRLRAHRHDPTIPASAGSGLSVTVQTFAPQIGLIHAQLLRTLGLERGAEPGPAHTPTEANITNPHELELVESLGALHLIYTSAAALASDNSIHWAKAQMYRQRFAEERQRAHAEIDLNNDARPDAIRRFNALQLTRL